MANLDGYGIRRAWKLYTEDGEQCVFFHRCDYDEAVRSGKYFTHNPKETKIEVKVEKAPDPIKEELPVTPIVAPEVGIRRRKVEEKEVSEEK